VQKQDIENFSESPVEHPDNNRNGSAPQSDQELSEEQSDALCGLEYTDHGNATAVYLLHKEEFLYCAEYGVLYYSGKCWEKDKDHTRLTAAIVDTLKKRKQNAQAHKQDDKENLSQIKTNAFRIDACLSLFTRLKGVHVDVSEFDRDIDLFNAANGVLHLPTLTLTAHDRSQRFTWCSPVPFDESADASAWDRFGKDVIEPDATDQDKIIEHFWECVGYSCTGHTSEEKSFFNHGPTRAGKGTFAEAWQAVLPPPIGDILPFSALSERREEDTQHFDFARLKPCRVLFASESKRDVRLDAAKLKMLTGGDTITAAYKHKDTFTYRPQFKIWMFSNWPINIDVEDDAAWTRPSVFSFPVSHADAPDTKLKKRLTSPENLKALLLLAARGAQRWYASPTGLVIPQAMKENVQKARSDLDMIEKWIEECCAVDDKSQWCSHNVLYASYQKWCDESGATKRGAKSFTQALERKGYKSVTKKPGGKSTRGFEGITTPEAEVKTELEQWASRSYRTSTIIRSTARREDLRRAAQPMPPRSGKGDE
jgi:putative DNA primase/helicase